MSDAQATVDHYATLGVAPRSEAAVIRAAYLALMRLYHPDKNSLSTSPERAQAITAAYAVLGDVDKRLKYDWARRRAAEELARASRRRQTNLHYGLIVASVLTLAIVPLALNWVPQKTTVKNAQPITALPTRAPFQSVPAGSKQLGSSSAPAVVVPRSGLVRRPIAKAAAIADPVPKDEMAEKAVPVKDLRAQVLSTSAPLKPRERQMVAIISQPIKPVVPGSRKCDPSTSGVEADICNNDNLAALDRLAATFYVQSLKVGNATKRAALFDAHYGFLDSRKACRSEACLRGAYLMHIRELTRIIESK